MPVSTIAVRLCDREQTELAHLIDRIVLDDRRLRLRLFTEGWSRQRQVLNLSEQVNYAEVFYAPLSACIEMAYPPNPAYPWVMRHCEGSVPRALDLLGRATLHEHSVFTQRIEAIRRAIALGFTVVGASNY